MAVTLTDSDFVEPDGELTADLFPAGNMAALLAGWLAQATTKVEGNAAIATENHDAAAAAWVYYRAYNHVTQRMNAEAESVRVEGEIAVTTKADQRQHFANKAAAALMEFTGYKTVTESSTSGAQYGPVTNVPVW